MEPCDGIRTWNVGRIRVWRIGWIVQITVIIAVTYFIVYSIQAFSGRSSHGQRTNTARDALQILAEWFAHGEISAEEYKAMKKHLK